MLIGVMRLSGGSSYLSPPRGGGIADPFIWVRAPEQYRADRQRRHRLLVGDAAHDADDQDSQRGMDWFAAGVWH